MKLEKIMVNDPKNELGVIVLFGSLAKKLNLEVDKIGPTFPDCLAHEITSKKKLRIEIEYQSSSFNTHHHDPSKCDCIVCWEHDWPRCPEHIRIIELRKFFDVGV
jgi:hypothetical protein